MCNWDTLYIIDLKLPYSLLMIKFPPVQLMLETTGLSGIQWSPKYRGTERQQLILISFVDLHWYF